MIVAEEMRHSISSHTHNNYNVAYNISALYNSYTNIEMYYTKKNRLKCFFIINCDIEVYTKV